MTFRKVVILAPAAYLMHILEEAPRFVAWARLHPYWFSATLSQTVFAVTNAIYMVGVVGAALLCVRGSAVTLGLSVILFLFSNAIFHIGFTIFSGAYSPGTVTAVVLYVPLTVAAFYCAYQERLLGVRRVGVATCLGMLLANAPLRIIQRWV